jgi:4-hydroxybenzoate polyprenyltransferase
MGASSRKINVKEATIFSFLLIAGALAYSYFLDRVLILFCLLFLAVNLLYSFILKKIPYVEIFVNSLTHLLRFYTGVVAAGTFGFHNIAALFWLFALGIATLKRKKELMEKQKRSRSVLKYYTDSGLRYLLISIGLVILILAVFNTGSVFYLGLAIFMLFATLTLGYHKLRWVKKLMDRWY